MTKPAILFVCTANICRSPMAAAIFKKVSAQIDPHIEWQIDSAGTWAVNGLMASEHAQAVIGSMGMDLSKHLSHDVAVIDLEKYDLIVTMEAGHKEALQVEHPELKDRMYMLSELVGSSFDIADPYGGTLNDYKETVALLENLIRKGYPLIKNLVRNPVE